jgi:hypothetical protein
MRCVRSVLTLSFLALNGCSAIIARSGTDVTVLKTQEQVHERYGEPSASGTDDGQVFEEFRTRRKVSDRISADGYTTIAAMTYCAAELITFPYTMYSIGHMALLGNRLRFAYDPDGRVTSITLYDSYILGPTLHRPDMH